MKALFYIAIVLVLCGAGIMVYDSLRSDELVMLRDSDMAQQTGGSPYSRALGTPSSGSFANCAPGNCPAGKKKYIHARYRCLTCVDGNMAFIKVSDYKTEYTWCDKAGDADCKTRVSHPDRQNHCKQKVGTCS